MSRLQWACFLSGVFVLVVAVVVTVFDRRHSTPVVPAVHTDTVIRYLGVSSVETMEGTVVVKFKPVKEAK